MNIRGWDIFLWAGWKHCPPSVDLLMSREELGLLEMAPQLIDRVEGFVNKKKEEKEFV